MQFVKHRGKKKEEKNKHIEACRVHFLSFLFGEMFVVTVVVVTYFSSSPTLLCLSLHTNDSNNLACMQSSEADASSLHGHCNVVIVELLTVISHPKAAPLALNTLHDCLARCSDLVLFVRRGLATAVCKHQQTHSVAADGFGGQQTGRQWGCFATYARGRGGLFGLLDLRLLVKVSLILLSSGVIISQQSDSDGCR